MLRDFWFPILLAVAGMVASVIGMAASGTPRRLAWSAMILCCALAGLSWVWGDPVRGPFANLLNPKLDKSDFRVHAGGGTIHYPVSALRDGIDLSDAIELPGTPVHLRISRRWLGGMRYSIRLGNGTAITNDAAEGIPEGWDLNSDGNAVELVDARQHPHFRVVQASDYDVYVTVVLSSPDGSIFTIIDGDRFLMNWPAQQLTAADFPTAIFRYPSYANRGKRQ